jgi:hypothetical protein
MWTDLGLRIISRRRGNPNYLAFCNSGRGTAIVEGANSKVLAGMIVLHIVLQPDAHGCAKVTRLKDDFFGEKNARMRFGASYWIG